MPPTKNSKKATREEKRQLMTQIRDLMASESDERLLALPSKVARTQPPDSPSDPDHLTNPAGA